MQNSIQLLLLDDHGLFRSSLSRFLSAEPDFEVVGECGTVPQALEVLPKKPLSVILVDLDLGADRASDFMLSARAAGFEGHFLVVAGAPDVRASAIALKVGAAGVFLKSEPPERLVRAIHRVADGEFWIDGELARSLAGQFVDRCPQWDVHPVTEILEDRERSVLTGIVGGLTNRKIGENMGLSESSVKNIVQRLFGKAGVKTRSQLVRVALEGNLAAPPPVANNHVNGHQSVS